MFYLIVSRLPIISSSYGNRLFRTFIIGTICYILLHAFLFSKYNSESEIINKYRSYIYYIWGVDLIVTGIITKLFGGTENDENDNEDSEEQINFKHQQKPHMPKDEINKKLLEMKQSNIPSPFIKKDTMSNNDQDKQPQNVQVTNEHVEEKKVEISDTEIPLYK